MYQRTFEIGRDLASLYSSCALPGCMGRLFESTGIRVHEVRAGRENASFPVDRDYFLRGKVIPENLMVTSSGQVVLHVQHTLHIVATTLRGGPVTADDLGSRVLSATKRELADWASNLVWVGPRGDSRLALVQQVDVPGYR